MQSVKAGVFALGLSNQVSCGKYLFFADYDHKTLQFVEKELKRLSKRFNLHGPMFLRRSKHGVHVFDLGTDDIFSIEELDVILSASSADEKFKQCLTANGENTIRLTPKTDGEFGPWYLFSPKPKASMSNVFEPFLLMISEDKI